VGEEGGEFHGGERELRCPDGEIVEGDSGNRERWKRRRKKGGRRKRFDRTVMP
jgi:hypothetical protein